MLVSRKKFYAICIMLLLIALEGIIFLLVQSNKSYLTTDQKLILVSVVCSTSFIIEIFLWWRLTREFFSPYMVFLLVLFIFTCGQSLGWSIGLDMGDRDLWNRVDHGLTRNLLIQGLSYSMLSISCFHLGAVFACKTIAGNKDFGKWTEGEVVSAFNALGKLMLVLCIPAFIAKTLQDILAVLAGGYSAYYVVNESRSSLMSLVSILADYYQPCMLILLIAHRNEKKYRRIIVGAMLIDVVFSLYIGGRSGAVMTLLGILLAYHYFVKPFYLKQTFVGCIVGYVGIAFLNGLATIRGVSGRGIGDFISAMENSFSNVIGDFIGELGWTLTSVCWTINLVPGSGGNFRYGMSYIAALISWIPSFIFGGRENHPTVIWANLSDWLQTSLGMGYGPGYTMVAESYINFGWFGLIAMLIEGMVIARIIAKVRRDAVRNNVLGATFQIMVIMIIMKSLVRSSLSNAFRSVVFTLIPIYILIYFTLQKGRKK